MAEIASPVGINFLFTSGCHTHFKRTGWWHDQTYIE